MKDDARLEAARLKAQKIAEEDLERRVIKETLAASKYNELLSEDGKALVEEIALQASSWSRSFLQTINTGIAGTREFARMKSKTNLDATVAISISLLADALKKYSEQQVFGIVMAERYNAKVSHDPSLCVYEAVLHIVDSVLCDRVVSRIEAGPKGDVQ